MASFIVTVVEKTERLRHIEVNASTKLEAEDKVLMQQSNWLNLPIQEEHSETYIDYIKEVK